MLNKWWSLYSNGLENVDFTFSHCQQKVFRVAGIKYFDVSKNFTAFNLIQMKLLIESIPNFFYEK